jgi:hypothetical protein
MNWISWKSFLTTNDHDFIEEVGFWWLRGWGGGICLLKNTAERAEERMQKNS